MRPTIYDVAEHAGVSIATVSRVLNNSPKPTEATKAKVLAAVRELGYHPSAAARCLARSTTDTIALVSPEISGPFFSEIIRGIELEARSHQYHVLIYGLQSGGEGDDLLPFLSTKVDGMILGTHSDEAYVRSLQEQGLPFVLMGRTLAGAEADSLVTDSFGGACDAVMHLIDHGYRRIGFIGGPTSSRQSGIRLRAYREAHRDRGWSMDERLVLHADFSEAGGQHAMEALLALAEPPRAVFAANDQMAVGAMDAVRHAGLGVPEDVALIGFDDIPVAAYLQPALTTVRANIRQSGALAVRLLVRRIADPDAEVETVLLPTELVIRQSCGCHPSDGQKGPRPQ